MATTFTTHRHAALLIQRFETWKELTGKDSFTEFIQNSFYETQLAYEIIADCARAYEREQFKPPTPK
jgi:hypothetical protein